MPLFTTHYTLEKHSMALVIAIILAASTGGLIEIAPLFTIKDTVDPVKDMRTYTPLELAGRRIYMREGCYACHSQMIRSLADEVDRYGPYSLAAESQYDHPMLWGSKRTGPDIARLGGKYSDAWQVEHLINPRAVVPSSIMPRYGWLMTTALDTAPIAPEMKAMQRVGVPYTDAMIAHAAEDAAAQATSDGSKGLTERYGKATTARVFDGQAATLTEMDALVAYLQVLGQLTQAPYARPGGAADAKS